MARTLADIDRDIAVARSQMRGALADLARLSRERATVGPTDRRARRIAFGKAALERQRARRPATP